MFGIRYAFLVTCRVPIGCPFAASPRLENLTAAAIGFVVDDVYTNATLLHFWDLPTPSPLGEGEIQQLVMFLDNPST